MKHLPPTPTLCGLLLLLLAGCGADAPQEPPSILLDGAPTWRLAREGLPGQGPALTLTARGPCRVRFRTEVSGGLGRDGPWRVLAAGQTVGVFWSHQTQPIDDADEAPGPEAAAAGRTELQRVLLRFQFFDGIQAREPFEVWTRPGRGRLLTRDLLPPGRSEPVPLDTPIELVTLAVTDLAQAQATLRNHDWSGRLQTEGASAPGDQTAILRLFLDVEPGTGP